MECSPDRPDGEFHETTFDPSHDRLPYQVVDAVASYYGTEPTALDPIYTAIDPDALEKLFAEPHRGLDPTVKLTFRYEDLTVSVQSDGTINLSDEPPR